VVSALFFNGTRDLTFNASGSLGTTAGQAFLPLSLLPGAQRIDFANVLLDAQRRITLFVRINDFRGDAFALRLLPDGQLDPIFRSSTQPGVVLLGRQGSDLTTFARAQIDEKLVYVEGRQIGTQYQTIFSRLLGKQTIFADGFD